MNEKKDVKNIKELLGSGKTIISLCCHDALSARIIEMAGFPFVMLSGFGYSGSMLAAPDFGLLTQTEIVRMAGHVSRAVSIPVMVDGDTGYGGPINVIRSVKELEAVGAKGMMLEDQVWPKRCGHMVGKQVVPMEEYEQKLLAALEARSDPDSFSILARTDALGPLGMDEAIKRANRYYELGADQIFVEAPGSKEEYRIIRENVPDAPLVANMIEGGLSPILPLEEFEELGYQIVGYPLTTIFAAAKAIKDAVAELKTKGHTKDYQDNLATFEEFTRIVRLPEFYDLEQKYSV
ncbi:isocitrate lyase/PEP mutase family protein [bacterium]|nr:isocitrate lyase/PEP mutase family protein [bacterium]